MSMLPDGAYDVVVVDAEPDDDGVVRLELAVTLGAHLGRVVTLRTVPGWGGRANAPTGAEALALSWMGVGGTLRVRDDHPHFRPETP